MIRAHNSIKVLITGTTGWLGGELAKKLAAQGHTVVGLARRATEIENVMSVQADLEDGASITGRGAYHVVSHHAVPDAEQKAWLDGVSFPRAAGCVGYDIVRATDAADHFVVIESWPSKGARLAHTLETDSYEESVYSDATVEEVFRGPGRLA